MSKSSFWKKVRKGTGCWEWSGALTTDGYGVTSRDGKYERAHRLAYELGMGQIPQGWDVHHECGNRSCVRPSHLTAIPHDLHGFMHANRPTHCPSNHPYDEINTYVTRRGTRQCRVCDRERKAVAYRLSADCNPIKEMVSSEQPPPTFSSRHTL